MHTNGHNLKPLLTQHWTMMRSVLLCWLAVVRGSARVFTSSCVGPPQPAVVSQDYYVSANGQKVFRAENLLTRNTAGETVADLWFPPSDKQQGEFVLDLGCVGRLAGAELVNTHNRQYRDRSTRAFTLATALTYTGPWTQVLSQELENSRQQVDPLPLQTFTFSAVARFVKFKIVSWHDDASAGGGLQYFFPILGESLLVETSEN